MSGNELPVWLKQAQKYWGYLAQAATWIGGIIGGFLLPPPVGADESNIWLKFAQFVVAACVGLMFLPSLRWGRKKHWTWWGLVGVLALILSIASFFSYQRLTYSSTCVTADGERVVIGAEYTQHGSDYAQKHPGISCADLIDQHVGKTEDVWTKQSIDSARLKLAATYIACLPLFTLCIMSVFHGIYCATREY